jgi:hypothetical protein
MIWRIALAPEDPDRSAGQPPASMRAMNDMPVAMIRDPNSIVRTSNVFRPEQSALLLPKL